ncbi:hypothetical protein QB910_000001 [Dabrowskivirus KKP3916]|uniref:Uncharacterized protein n=1 Tax=Alicyclobacillus phage KKP_3916 TaxID=3040651 RepID=A0AAT9V7D6_9CAUD|nr:hypothetical protein QB910_000001 [Alicyclobacillus phage KKP 3916]
MVISTIFSLYIAIGAIYSIVLIRRADKETKESLETARLWDTLYNYLGSDAKVKAAIVLVGSLFWLPLNVKYIVKRIIK